MKIVALTTCHNRRELTLRALKCLHEQILPEGCTLEICLVDDGSTDGTGEAVKAAYPDVKVLQGTGDLYWAGGMRFGWDNYVKHQDFDYLVVFNDDVLLYSDAIEALLGSAKTLESNSCKEFVVAGAFMHPDTGETTYGGVIRCSWWHPLRFKKIVPTESHQECDTLNMNFALITKNAIDKIGFLSKNFAHAKSDYDFGLRLRKMNGTIVLAPAYIGECRSNPIKGASLEEGIPFNVIWKRLTSIKEQNPRERAVYYRRNAGPLWPLYWMLPYFRIIMECTLSFLFSTKRRKK